MGRTAAIVAALCVLSSVAVAATGSIAVDEAGRATTGAMERSGAIDGSAPVVTTPPQNTTAYLAIPPANVSNATTADADLDVGGALALDAAATSEAIPALALDERLSRANTTAAKQVVIERTGSRIERRIDRLLVRQRAAIEAYSDGERSTREFVGTLARIETRASALRRTIDRLDSAAASVPGTAIGGESVDSWARDRRVEVGLLTSPIRAGVVGALRGIDPIETYVEVTDTGVVLATVDNGRYVREAYLPAERDDGPPDGPDSTSAALDRVRTVYPWAWNHSTGFESAGGPAAGSYRITLFHQQGRLATHLDPGTGTVFREIQVKPLNRVPTAPPVTASEDGLRMGVHRTYATGPMNVSVAEAGTGEPANATVLVDNRTVGRTGPGGSLWTITPRGEVNVTVSSGERTVTVRFASNPQLTTNEQTAPGATPLTPSASGEGPTLPGNATVAENGSTPPSEARPTGAGNDTDTDTETETGTGTGTENDPGPNASAVPAGDRSVVASDHETW